MRWASKGVRVSEPSLCESGPGFRNTQVAPLPPERPPSMLSDSHLVRLEKAVLHPGRQVLWAGVDSQEASQEVGTFVFRDGLCSLDCVVVLMMVSSLPSADAKQDYKQSMLTIKKKINQIKIRIQSLAVETLSVPVVYCTSVLRNKTF